MQSIILRCAWALCITLVAGCQAKTKLQTADAPDVKPSAACAKPLNLSGFDSRTPVPLQPMMAWHQKQNMMQHLVAIQRIVGAVATEKWDEVASASSLIESSPQMQQMCQHMGAGAEGFTEKALEFHSRADAIGEAARAKDGTAVLKATSYTLEACTGCHATFRQEIVDAQAWQARTGSSHNPASRPATMPSAP